MLRRFEGFQSSDCTLWFCSLSPAPLRKLNRYTAINQARSLAVLSCSNFSKAIATATRNSTWLHMTIKVLGLQIKVLKKVVEALHKGQFFMDAKMLGMEGNSDCQGVECLLIVSAMLSQEVQATTDSSWFWKQLSDTNQVTSLQLTLRHQCCVALDPKSLRGATSASCSCLQNSMTKVKMAASTIPATVMSSKKY